MTRDAGDQMTIDRLEWQGKNAQEAADRRGERLERVEATVGQLEAQKAALLAALEAVEWVFAIGRETGHESNGRQCPSCLRWQIPASKRWPQGFNEGHAPDCQLAAALALAKGETS